jgi:hypothetical protein
MNGHHGLTVQRQVGPAVGGMACAASRSLAVRADIRDRRSPVGKRVGGDKRLVSPDPQDPRDSSRGTATEQDANTDQREVA